MEEIRETEPAGVAIEKVKQAAYEVTEDLATQILGEVKERLGDVGVKPSTLSLVIRYTMEAIEKTPVKGPAQMDFALRVISDLINELPESDEKNFLRQTMDSGGIRDTIELVVQATKGEIDVNLVVSTVTTHCLGPCINYVVSKCRGS